MSDLQSRFQQILKTQSDKVERWVIALSGGLDSVVLLHLAARTLPPEKILVLHVDHQLQLHSAHWADFCRQQADALNLEFQSYRVEVDAGASLERAARDARYRVFEQVLQEGDCLLLAQHLDDQAETMLFRMMRGAGLKGLAGMPVQRKQGKGMLLRPLQSFSRSQLQRWADDEKLSWIEDPSNSDLTFDRNFLRHQVMPLLDARWPGFISRWGDTSRYLREADQLLEELAASDLRALRDSMGGLDCEALLKLSDARRRNLLRFWLHDLGINIGERLIKSIMQVITAAGDADPRLDISGVAIRRYRGRLFRSPVGQDTDWSRYSLSEEGLLLGNGVLEVSRCPGSGLKTLKGVLLRNRRDGDRCAPVGRGGSTSLKKLFQEHNIPPWLRSSWPVCEVDGEIVAVPGICICEGWQSEKNIVGFTLKWVPSALFADSDSGTL